MRAVNTNTNAPLPGGTATIGQVAPFTPTNYGAPITATTSGVTSAALTGAVQVVSNVGSTNGAYCEPGGTTSTSGQYIGPQSWFAFNMGSNTTITCLTATSTTTLNLVGGTGTAAGVGGGGGGSGGGAVTQSGTWTMRTVGNAGGVFDASTGSSVPANALYAGMNVGGNLTGLTGTANGLKVDGSAVTQPVAGTGTNSTVVTSSSFFPNVASSTLTRPADTTTYTANTTVCAAKTVTACSPMTVSIGGVNAGRGRIERVTLLKSGSSVTGASFNIWFFSAAPGLTTPTQYDNTAYSGPRAADMPNYIGYAACSNPLFTSDTTAQVWYDCTLSNPNNGNTLDFQALSGSTNLNAVISTTAAFAPAANSETFTFYVSGTY